MHETPCRQDSHLSARMALATSAAIAVLAFGGGAAYAAASSGAGPNGVIHGCVSNARRGGAHMLLIIEAHTSCPKGMTALAWNQQGPPGQPGPAGPQGSAGPSSAGTSGLDVIQMIATTDNGETIATRPADHPFVIGGGYAEDGLQASEPGMTAGSPHLGTWTAIDMSGQGAADHVRADALCAK